MSPRPRLAPISTATACSDCSERTTLLDGTGIMSSSLARRACTIVSPLPKTRMITSSTFGGVA